MVSRKSEKDWTPDRVSRFWSWQNEEGYFSYHVSEGIVNLLKITGRLAGNALDYVCGGGYLIERLLQEDVDCYGIDVYKEAIEDINERYKANVKWHGATKIESLPTSFDDNFFDVVTCIEIIEQVSSDHLATITYELLRILKPGGIALFTTPYAEDLEKSMVYCPFCDSEFHSKQHLRSFDEKSLQAVLSSSGFTVLFCDHVNLLDFQDNSKFYASSGSHALLRYLSLRGLDSYNRFKNRSNRLFDTISNTRFPFNREITKQSGKGPHLCAFATKSNQRDASRG